MMEDIIFFIGFIGYLALVIFCVLQADEEYEAGNDAWCVFYIVTGALAAGFFVWFLV